MVEPVAAPCVSESWRAGMDRDFRRTFDIFTFYPSLLINFLGVILYNKPLITRNLLKCTRGSCRITPGLDNPARRRSWGQRIGRQAPTPRAIRLRARIFLKQGSRYNARREEGLG